MWLRIPTRIPTSHCSPATEDSTSPSDALCQRLAVSVSWRGKLLRPQSWRLAWKTEGWRTRLSGLTLSPSQADCFVAAWLDSLAGFPAKTSALPADKQESRESGADCSSRLSDSFASWNRSSGCFLKTSRQSSLFQQEQPFSENLPKSGSMRNGELFERPMLVDRTGESGRLCWPTAVVTDSNGARNETSGRSMASQHHSGTTLNDAIIKWPTPRSADSESCGNYPGAVDSLTGAARMWQTPATDSFRSRGGDRKHEMGLDQEARMWHTPKAHENAETSGTFVSRNADRGAHCFSGLGAQTMHWPTPQARDVKSPDMEGSGNYERKMENGWTIDLNSAAANWPTPNACDGSKASQISHQGACLTRSAEVGFRFFLPVPPTSTHGGKSPSGSTRRLNPDFVDWLMGLPPGWTDYAPLETASYLSRVRSLLRSYLGGRAE